jgi:phospholipase/carboxylesterase
MIDALVHVSTGGFYRGQLDRAGKLPFTVALPQGYEPRYPYPLLVMLHCSGQDESQWLQALPSTGRRNYVGLALRGPYKVDRPDGPPKFSWGGCEDDAILDEYLFAAIEQTMRGVHVHTERIFLVGLSEGARVCYRTGLFYPGRFAGIAAFDTALPPGCLSSLRRLGPQTLSILIGHRQENPHVTLDESQQAARLLWSAGFNVTLRIYSSGRPIQNWMLRDLDRWVVAHCDPAAKSR